MTGLAALLCVVAFDRPVPQTALQTPGVVPSGRVCNVRNFGPPLATAGRAEPILFTITGNIITDSAGNLYSTSNVGGKYGVGTIFEVSPAGQLTVLHDFIRYDTLDGAGPQSGLVDGHDGYFYGTTYGGGLGTGTLFRFKPGMAKPQLLFRFRNGSTSNMLPDCPNHRCPFTGRQRADISAGYPTTPPVIAAGGVIYGVTAYSNNQYGGVLYRTAPPYDSASFHALCIFDQRLLADTAMAPFVCKTKDYFPNALLLAPDGSTLYGTTLGGNGSIIRATTGGDVTSIHEFDLAHGSKPYNLMLASNGKLYGTTSNGGGMGAGTVFRLETSGDGLLGGGFTMMTSFRVGIVVNGVNIGTSLQGLNPVGGLVEVQPPGSVEPFLYGTTKYGGKGGRGILFRIPLEGDSLSLRVLHDFDLYTTGRTPVIAMVRGAKGLLYGLTYQGGTYDNGVLFSLDPIVLNDQTSHDAFFIGGVHALSDNKVLISDSIAEVWTDATAGQSGYDSTGTVKTNSMDHGIIVRGRCPNPHIVQFLYRERISPQGQALPGLDSVGAPPLPGRTDWTAETYPLTTNTSDIHWHTDSPKFPMGRYEQRNAYLDQGNGSGHQSTPNMAAIFDRPSFGVFTDANRPSSIYLPAGQNADLTKSETWRATARDFIVCNCQVSREVWWSREVRGAKVYFAHIKIVKPAPDALDWINAHLKSDGYAPIP